MEYFKTVVNSSLGQELADHLERLVCHIEENAGVDRAHILDMFYSDACTFEILKEFLDESDRNLDRSLFAILINDFKATHENDEDSKNKINKILEVSSLYDHAYIDNNGEPSSEGVLIEFGMAGIYHSILTSDDEVNKKCSKIIYDVIRNEERAEVEYASNVSEFIAKIMVSARYMSISEERPYSDVMNAMRLPKWLDIITSEDFLSMSEEDQSLAVEDASSAALCINGDAFGIDEYKMLAARWPVEFIRSRLIAGDDPSELCELSTTLIGTLLKKAELSQSEIGEISENIKKSALFPFPKDFEKVFGCNLLDVNIVNDAIYVDHEDDDRSFPYWLGIGFHDELNSSFSVAKTVDVFYSYGYEKTEKFDAIIRDSMKDDCFSELLCKHSLIDKPHIYINYLLVYLNGLEERDQQICDTGLKAIYQSVCSRDNDAVSLAYNRAVLNSFLGCPENIEKDLSISIPSEAVKAEAVRIILSENIRVSKSLIRSGGFTPHDFSKGWKGARSDTKKSFIMNDLGM